MTTTTYGIEQNVTLHGSVAKNNSIDAFIKPLSWNEADHARNLGILPYYREISQNEGVTCSINGREVIMLGSNNYLGLTTHPQVRQAAAQALLDYGPSLTGSRLLNGTTSGHIELEKKLARFLKREDALVFTTGYQANIGLLSALLDKNSVLIMDRYCHASIIDGARVSLCRIVPFKHNSVASLERKLKSASREFNSIMVMVDGVYSMEGDITPLPEIAHMCKEYGARLVVDDAHGLGVIGNMGHGTEAHFNYSAKADLLSGTFSKSLASIGGWVAGDAKVIDYIRYHGRSGIFSASLPPAQLMAASVALDILTQEPFRVSKLSKNSAYWRNGLASLGFRTNTDCVTPIIPVHIGDMFKCMAFSQALLEAGVYVNTVAYPAVPKNCALLRTSVMATHEPEHLDKALEIFSCIGKGLGIIK